MKALGKWIVCEEVTKTKTDSGLLHLPVDTPGEFVVSSIGSDVELDLEEGDAVIFMGKNAVKHNKIALVHEKDMIMVL